MLDSILKPKLQGSALTDRLGNAGVHVTAIFLICYLILVLPIQIQGLPSGFDMLTVIRFATAFQDGILAGDFLPGWAGDNLGFGSIGIRFYPPLAIYLLAVFEFFTGDWFGAFLLSLYLWMVVGCIGVYLVVREWSTATYGLVAAALYALSPQHLSEVFQFFMFAEFAAWGVIPYCFLFATRVGRGGTLKDAIFLGISLSVLILTHIPTSVIVAISLPIYVLFLLDWSKFKAVSKHFAVAGGLVLLATSFRWIVLVREMSWLAHSGPEHYGSGYYDFSKWLFPNVLTPRSMTLYELTSLILDIGIVLTISLLVPALFLLRNTIRSTLTGDRVIAASTVTALFAIFLLSRPSFYIWENLVLLQKLQFPWRWMSVISLLAVVAFALALRKLILTFQRYKRVVVYSALTLILGIALFDITQLIVPSGPLNEIGYREMKERIHTEEIWKGWWPTWAKAEAFKNQERVNAGYREVTVSEWVPESRVFTVEAGMAKTAGIRSFYYPLWKAEVNNLPVNVGMDPNGAILLPLSEERSTVRLYFEEPFVNSVAVIVSATTWALVPILLSYIAYSRRRLRIPKAKSAILDSPLMN